MARVNRECRAIEPSIGKRAYTILTNEAGWSTKPFTAGNRNFPKENVRATKLMQPWSFQTRNVPAFTIQTKQNNTKTISSDLIRRSKSLERMPDETSQFRTLYVRGDLQAVINHSNPSGSPPKDLKWRKHPNNMKQETLAYLLPKFALGLSIIDQPYRSISEWGTLDLLNAVKDPSILIPILPHLVRGIRASLYSFDVNKRRFALELISILTQKGECGPALVPFYRQILPPLRQVSSSTNSKQLDDLINKTLNKLEKTGGSRAFINIKYVIPTYDSCLNGL